MLDGVGLGPVETPSRVVFAESGVALHAYGEGPGGSEPVLLIIPAPIKRAYLWDLDPAISVVRQCLRAGLCVFMNQWEQPGVYEQEFGLAEYADRLILDGLQAIEARSGQRQAFLAGHSLGGTFAAIFAALHPERVRGLVLIEAPVHFDERMGAFGPLVARAPRADALTARRARVPGSFLDAVSHLASPTTFIGSPQVDRLQSALDLRALRTHLRVVRWMLDEMPLPRKLFNEVVDGLYREDRFMRGVLAVDGRSASPDRVRCPILSVVEPHSRVVPARSVLPLHRVARSTDTQVLWYGGDVGVALQHAGALVGRRAHRDLWPKILDWIRRHP
jgi:polyhydroxyalkanoate synthase